MTIVFSPSKSAAPSITSHTSRKKKGSNSIFDSISIPNNKDSLTTIGLGLNRNTFQTSVPTSARQRTATTPFLSPSPSRKLRAVASTSELVTGHSGVVSTPKKDKAYGEIGLGHNTDSTMPYSSMEEMLFSSGFSETRVVTPAAIRLSKTPSDPTPKSNSKITRAMIYPPYSRGMRRTYLPPSRVVAGGGGGRTLKNSKSSDILKGIFSIFSPNPEVAEEVYEDDQSSIGSMGSVESVSTSRASVSTWLQNVSSSSGPGSTSTSSAFTEFYTPPELTTPPTSPGRKLPLKSNSTRNSSPRHEHAVFTTTSFSPPMVFGNAVGISQMMDSKEREVEEYESFHLKDNFRTPPLSPLSQVDRPSSPLSVIPVIETKPRFTLHLRKSFQNLKEVVGGVILGVAVPRDIPPPVPPLPATIMNGDARRQPGLLRKTKSCIALKPILTVPEFDLSTLPATTTVRPKAKVGRM